MVLEAERGDMAQTKKKGTWVEERTLGSGGFGAVNLWRDEETGQRIALKKCRLETEMTPKHKQRWELEIQIMKRLNHENVIMAYDVPEALDVLSGQLPILAMEYCSGGDLRRHLNLPENCCGLKEYNIRWIVNDMAGAVEYLHSNRIIHRDLKPENIVLKHGDERTIYKIIDLGYAKELDQGSVCTSFVGTLQYLAPELFASQKYTCTVDYWSFGTVVFECIAGYRPFLPNSPPVQWHKEVYRKSLNDICAKMDDTGDVRFYKTVPTKNRLCRSMQTYLEQWLRYMLRWDAKQRGGGLSKDSRPVCFSMIENILTMKIIYILHVETNTILTYPIMEKHTMYELQTRIEDETKMPVAEQDLILVTGMSPDQDKLASQCWLEQSEQECFIYLFHKGSRELKLDELKKKNRILPPLVQSIVKNPCTVIQFSEQRRAWAESVYFCDEACTEFKRLLLSQKAAMLSLLRFDSFFVKTKVRMINEHEQLTAKIEYFQESLEHDMMFYEEQAKNGGITSGSMQTKWKRMADEVINFKTLKDKVNDLEQQTAVVQTKIVELQRSPFSKPKQDDVLDELANQAKKLYAEFKQRYRDSRESTLDQKPIVTVVVKSIMYRDKKIPDLFAHLGKICACKADIEQLLPQVEGCLNEILKGSNKLIDYQKHRQTAIWKLVEVALAQNKNSPLASQQQGNDVTDDSLLCRNDLNPMAAMNNTNNTSMMSSLMSSSAMESLKIVEDSKETSKLFEEAMNNMIQEHDNFSSMVSVISNDSLTGSASKS